MKVTHNNDFKDDDWWWIDSLCINLEDGYEREKQVQIMAEIYKRATRAIIWLGQEVEENSDCTGAMEFLHRLSKYHLAFTRIEGAMREKFGDAEFSAKCQALSNLLFRPWWTRVRFASFPCANQIC